jgi:hypothetical protein
MPRCLPAVFYSFSDYLNLALASLCQLVHIRFAGSPENRKQETGSTMQNAIFSMDSAKAIKAKEYGFLNGIHYLAPSKLSGFDLCSHASLGCIKLCLGWESGQASMVKLDTDLNSVRKSRIQKAQRFMKSRAAYLLDVIRSIDNTIAKAGKVDLRLCLRMNGASDIAFEGIRFTIERNAKGKAVKVTLGGTDAKNIFDHYPEIPFVDYTKNPKRFDRQLPSNYHLTFSRSETNESTALELLARGINVAVVFETVPTQWNGFAVIDGDKHDLRQLDPRGAIGTVIGLLPKGRKAKRDTSGFVVRG